MTDIGIRISLAGSDAQDATIQQLALSSKYPILKIAVNGTSSLLVPKADGSGNPGYATISIAHSLGYIPMFRIFGSDSANWKSPMDFRIRYGTPHLYAHARITSSNLIVDAENSDSVNAHAIQFNYYIFADGGS